MHLLEKYSLNCGINPEKIGRGEIYQSYYPLPYEKYIVIHASSGMKSKNYSYYQDIIDFIYQPLTSSGYKIIQIGAESDSPLSKCLNLQGKTNIHQTAYILKNCSLLIANDSFSTHMCSSFGVPTISLYSVIQPEVAGPFWKNGKQICIMAPLENRKPCYCADDSEKSIDKIKPEEIIEKIPQILDDVNFKNINLKTIHIGKNYPNLILEFVPNFDLFIDKSINSLLSIRFDYLNSKINDFNIKCALTNLIKRKCAIITSQAFDISSFSNESVKNNILSLIVNISKKEYSNIDELCEFAEKTKKLGISTQVTVQKDKFSDEEINEIKFKFLDICPVSQLANRKPKKELKSEDQKKINSLTFYKSSRIIYSNGKNFISKAAYLKEKPAESFQQRINIVGDLGDFSDDIDNIFIFNLNDKKNAK
jgi:hypothetical protein